MQNYQTLIRAGELAAILNDPQLIVVDVRHDLSDHGLGARKYAESHIPGAHFMSVENDLAATPVSYTHLTLPTIYSV